MIWNRLRYRQPYTLINEFHPIIQIFLHLLCLWLSIIILINLYNIFFVNKKNSKSENSYFSTILIKLKNTKILQYFLNCKYLKNIVSINMYPGIFTYLLNEGFMAINKYNFVQSIFGIIFNLLVFKNSLLHPFKQKKIKEYCNTYWTRFLFNYTYIIFSFVPGCVLQIIGLFKIFYYYRFSFLLLPAFILQIVLSHQIFHDSREQRYFEETYNIMHVGYIFTGDNTKFYNIFNIEFSISKEMDAQLSKEECEDVKAILGYHCLTETAATQLSQEMDAPTILKLVLMIISLLFLIALLYY
jgi:hypothetical protein